MNDLSRLTHPTLRLRLRSDLFAERQDAELARAVAVQVLEKCDACGAVVSLYEITFTGVGFHCLGCLGR
jgi:hypothetical protein